MAASTNKFRASFREEVFGLLSQLEGELMRLKASPGDAETTNRVFRAIHTIKGSAAMFGFGGVSGFAQEMERVFDLCRSGRLQASADLLGAALEGRDQLRQLMEFEDKVPEDIASKSGSLLRRFEAIASSASFAGSSVREPAQAPDAGKVPGSPERPRRLSYRIGFKPPRRASKGGPAIGDVLAELSRLGPSDVYPHMEEVPPLTDMDPEDCYAWWEIVLTTEADREAIRETLGRVADGSELQIALVGGALGEPNPRIGAILVDRGVLDEAELRLALDAQRRLGEVLIERHAALRPQVEAGLMEQAHLRRVRSLSGTGRSVPLASGKVDSLLGIAHELEILARSLEPGAFGSAVAGPPSSRPRFESLLARLRGAILGLSMMPLEALFEACRPALRELSLELGKEASLTIEGSATEVEQSIAAKLGEALVRIVGDALENRIERPDIRARAGKPPAGTIAMSARTSGSSLMIDISDDGDGLDRHPDRVGTSIPSLVSSARERAGIDLATLEIEALGGSLRLSSRPGLGSTVSLMIPVAGSDRP